MPERERNDDFRFEILKHIGVVGKNEKGWFKEINIVSWRGGKPKLDIRDWEPGHERMSRGVTMRKSEVLKTMQILMEHYGEEFRQFVESAETSETDSQEEPVEAL